MPKIRLMAAAILVFACPAAAVPPPPPLPDTINAVQAIIAAMTSKDFAGYDHVLADNFVGHKAEANEVLNRESWLHEIHEAFDNKVFSVTVVNVYEGATTTDGKFRPQVMLIERVSNFGLHGGIPGDCCAYYLTETLTLENGKVIRIDRSPLFSSELSKTGERTDLQ